MAAYRVACKQAFYSMIAGECYEKEVIVASFDSYSEASDYIVLMLQCDPHHKYYII